MDIGLSDAFGGTPARDAGFIQEYAARAEALGFDSLWAPEHIVFFDRYDSRYPYNESGVLDLGANPGIFDPFLALTVAALATTRLKLGTSVLLIGERNPLLTARGRPPSTRSPAGASCSVSAWAGRKRSTRRSACRGSGGASGATSTSR